MGGRFPIDAAWSELDGPRVISTDLQTVTLPAAPSSRIVTGWKYGPVTNYAHTGTATGQQIRCSAAEPPGRSDDTLLLPGSAEWRAGSFDVLAGTTPATQGWGGPAAGTLSGGLYRINGSGEYHTRANSGITAGRNLVIQYWRWCRGTGHTNSQSMQLDMPYSGPSNGRFALYGGGGGSIAGGVYNPDTGAYIPGLVLAVDDVWDNWLVTQTDGSKVLARVLWARNAGVRGGSVLADSVLDGVTLFPNVLGGVSGGTSVYFGDTAGGTTNVYWGSVKWADLATVDRYGWEALANPDNSFARGQAWVQIDCGKNGTLTDMTLTGVPNTNAFGGNITVDVTHTKATLSSGEHSDVVWAASDYANLTLNVDGVSKTVDGSALAVTANESKADKFAHALAPVILSQYGGFLKPADKTELESIL